MATAGHTKRINSVIKGSDIQVHGNSTIKLRNTYTLVSDVIFIMCFIYPFT